MKWIAKLTKITSYVSQCANAIAKAVEALSNNWPTDSPFTNSNNGDGKEQSRVAVGSETK